MLDIVDRKYDIPYLGLPGYWEEPQRPILILFNELAAQMNVSKRRFPGSWLKDFDEAVLKCQRIIQISSTIVIRCSESPR